MSTPTESQGKAERNTQAIASLILGVLSVVLIPIIDCVPTVAALLALVAGVRGIRAARELDGRGRKLAIAGMVIGGLVFLVTTALFVSSMYRAFTI